MSDIVLDLYSRFGQSLWLDGTDRNLLTNGSVKALVSEGVRGITGNLEPFRKALAETAIYDEAIRDLMQADHRVTGATLCHWLLVQDVQTAADLLKPVHDVSDGVDGHACMDMPPYLAHDTPGTIDAARHLWRQVDRPNLMLGVPATDAGLAAVEELVSDGINVNATLLFSPERYVEAAKVYLDGATRNRRTHAASVASFSVGAIDAAIDPLLAEKGAGHLRGRAGLSLAALAYERFAQIYARAEFEPYRQRGAGIQPLLWADTDAAARDYPDLMYLEGLIGARTVCAVSSAVLTALEHHGELTPSLGDRPDSARRHVESLEAAGVDTGEATRRLLAAAVEKAEDEYDRLVRLLDGKREEAARRFAGD